MTVSSAINLDVSHPSVMDDILSVHNDESPLQQQGPTKAEKKVIKNKPSLALAIYTVVWTQFWKAAMWKFIYDMCVVVVIVLVGLVQSFLYFEIFRENLP